MLLPYVGCQGDSELTPDHVQNGSQRFLGVNCLQMGLVSRSFNHTNPNMAGCSYLRFPYSFICRTIEKGNHSKKLIYMSTAHHLRTNYEPPGQNRPNRII